MQVYATPDVAFTAASGYVLCNNLATTSRMIKYRAHIQGGMGFIVPHARPGLPPLTAAAQTTGLISTYGTPLAGCPDMIGAHPFMLVVLAMATQRLVHINASVNDLARCSTEVVAFSCNTYLQRA